MTPERLLNGPELLAALDWYRAVGVELAVGDTPVDRFAAARITSAQPAAPVARQRGTAPPPANEVQAATILNAEPAETRALAAGAATLEALKELMAGYEGCVLSKRATQLVFADGNPHAEIMLVGEGPGADEDRIGRPFVGRAGQLLDKMLAAIGLDRTKVYIANMVPWRPPGNRNPSPEELALCAPFLMRQIELVAPKILVTLGNVPTQYLFETRTGITRLRGQWRKLTVNGHEMDAMASWHPAYLLRQPGAKQQSWHDLISLKQMIEKRGAPAP